MLKRIIPFLCAAVVLMASLSPSVGAVSRDDYYDIDLRDYFVGDSERVIIPKELSAVQTIDINGTTYLEPGVFNGTVSSLADVGSHMAIGAYWPGGFISGVFIDATPVPNGTQMSVDCQFTLSDIGFQTEIGVYAKLGVQYFDANFQSLGAQYSSPTYWVIDDSQVNGTQDVSLTLQKPVGAAYFVYYAVFDMNVMRSNDSQVSVNWWIGTPNFLLVVFLSKGHPGQLAVKLVITVILSCGCVM